MFDLSDYNVRQLDPQQGTKPLDFGGGGITGSVNLDGRLIAINTYHPEHGYITLTSIPPFPDEDRYDQQKVRAYRKSLVTNEGFGLQFEQDIIKQEYYLIEDAVPFMRFTLEDGTIAECMTITETILSDNDYPFFMPDAKQFWRFSRTKVKAKWLGSVRILRTAYTQLTEGGVLKFPSANTIINHQSEDGISILNSLLGSEVFVSSASLKFSELKDGSISFKSDTPITFSTEYTLRFIFNVSSTTDSYENSLEVLEHYKEKKTHHTSSIIGRARAYALTCLLHNGCMVTDHMILPLLWNRDSYYVAKSMLEWHPNGHGIVLSHLKWLFRVAWRGTFCKAERKPLTFAWGRAYMANGMPKDNKAFQLDQLIFPFLELAEYINEAKDIEVGEKFIVDVEQFIVILHTKLPHLQKPGIYATDETPADDEIPLHYHFSSHVLLWFTLGKLKPIFMPLMENRLSKGLDRLYSDVKYAIKKYFITEHKGKQIYSYATDGEGNHYLYHDANDIPLVMMPLWGFCDKYDPIWRNTIDFAFSSDNPGFYGGVLGSVHTPAPWSLGDAQELILSKVIGDRERYQRVWERVEKAAQWDGALPEAYDANTFEVVSRHWFAWANAMVAIADSISWDWETEGEYAR